MPTYKIGPLNDAPCPVGAEAGSYESNSSVTDSIAHRGRDLSVGGGAVGPALLASFVEIAHVPASEQLIAVLAPITSLIIAVSLMMRSRRPAEGVEGNAACDVDNRGALTRILVSVCESSN
jgi:hypothetical protein